MHLIDIDISISISDISKKGYVQIQRWIFGHSFFGSAQPFIY
jgi:hypothetical protein